MHCASYCIPVPLICLDVPRHIFSLAPEFNSCPIVSLAFPHPQEKERFPEMLDLTYLIVGTTCFIIGSSGYLLYGDKAMEEVTMNLRAGLVADLTTCLILISPFTKFALTLDPVSKGFEKVMTDESEQSIYPITDVMCVPVISTDIPLTLRTVVEHGYIREQRRRNSRAAPPYGPRGKHSGHGSLPAVLRCPHGPHRVVPHARGVCHLPLDVLPLCV